MTHAHPALATERLTVGYGGLAVARDIDLCVGHGEILAILGPNGAGKTTVLLSLAGFLPHISGTVSVGGAHIAGGSPRRANQAGVVLVPDNRALFTQLTTVENLQLAASPGTSIDRVLEVFPALTRRASLRAGQLSGGEQQMLAVARALVQSPRVLLIDEMSMGLAPVIVESLMPLIRQVADESDAAVLLVEQHVQLALEIADHALVLVHGDVTVSGSAEDVRADALALEGAYLGGAAAPGLDSVRQSK